MADWENQAKGAEVFRIQPLARNEENDRLCKGFLEHLRSNQVVRILHLGGSSYFGSADSSKILGEVVGRSTTLEELALMCVGMDENGLEYIIRGLLTNPNPALVVLDISFNTKLGKKGAELVEELLLGNIPALKNLRIMGTGFPPEDTPSIARALAINTTLHDLACGGRYGIVHPDRDGPLSSILRALTPAEEASDEEGKKNATLHVLTMLYEYERGLAKNLGRMLSRNSSLQGLKLWDFQFSREEWAEVWKALRHNKCLKFLDLSGCGKGLSDAFVDLMDLLEANRTISHICMAKTQLEADRQSVQVEERVHRNNMLAGTHREKVKDIMGRLEFKIRNWRDPSDSMAIVNVGRELAQWATSSSTAAVVPIETIHMALVRLLEIIQMLSTRLQHQVAKPLAQDIVSKLTDKINPMLEDVFIYILLEYARICTRTFDFQDVVECCKRGISLVAGRQKDIHKCYFHLYLGNCYMNLSDAPQAEEQLRDARNSMPHNLEVFKNIDQFPNTLAPNSEAPKIFLNLEADIEGAEGSLALLQSRNCSTDVSLKFHKEGIAKLEKCLEGLTRRCASPNASLFDKENMVKHALYLSKAASHLSSTQSFAKTTAEKALRAAKYFQLSPLIAQAAFQCGDTALSMMNYEAAESYVREGLEELGTHDSDQPVILAALYAELGKILQSRGESHLPKAEEAFRHALKILFDTINKRTLTSEFRIRAFETDKIIFNLLQSCLYAIYMQAEENQRGRKAIEALVVAEQGRCRDLMFNLKEPFTGRIAGIEGAVRDDNVSVMDWDKFDTDGEYAWRHLEKCMAICTDVIKEQNPDVKRVTFVEYTMTSGELLIWVLHSYGTQEPGIAHTTSTLPSMYSVDVNGAFKETVTETFPDVKEYFEQVYGPQEWASNYIDRLLAAQTVEAVGLFEDNIEKLRSDPGPGKRKLTQLYELLIKPIEIADNLVDGEPLIFIPHEALSFVPYAALRSKNGKHLIENHPIGVAYSLRTLGWATKQYIALHARRTVSENRMLLVADPHPLGVDKDPLEDSIEEVEKIAKITFPQYSPKVLKQKDASLITVVSHMKTTSWYHIACHGEVMKEYPQGVLFLGKADMNEGASSSSGASDRYGRGFLTPEIIAKDLESVTARAAVLSACKVGLGKRTGEGLLGLSRAFMQAGVPLVIAPLRTVDSKLCSAFMQHLYKKLVKGESVMFALRNTMVDVIKQLVKAEDDDKEDMEWQVWDWAAWLAVGFPGVCLTSLTTPKDTELQHSVAKLAIANEDLALTTHVEFLSEHKNLSSHEKASCSDFPSDSDLIPKGKQDNNIDQPSEGRYLTMGPEN